MGRVVAIVGLVALLVGCGGAAATPTTNVAPTQTRAAELAVLATAQAPTATPAATATPEPTSPPAATPTPVAPTATAIPTATNTPRPPSATATPNLAAPMPTISAESAPGQFPVLLEPRDLAKDPGGFREKKMALVGDVLSIKVAEQGKVWVVGEFRPRVTLQINVFVAETKRAEFVAFVIYDGDTAGIFEKTTVVVYGIGKGTFEITNAYGGKVAQPLLYAQLVKIP